MPRSPRFPLRRWIYRTHLIAGIITGIIALLLGLSGSVLLFRADLQRFANPELQSSAPFSHSTSLDAVVSEFQRTHPGQRIRSVIIPAAGTRDPIQLAVMGEDGSTARLYFDGASGLELPAQASSKWVTWLVQLHHNLFADGHFYTGLAGAALTYLCVTGVVVWWPGIRHLKLTAAFAPHRLRSLRARDIHVAVGVWTVLLLAVIAFTGTVFTWREPYTRAALAVTGASYKPKRVQINGDARRVSLDAALASARAALPGATPTMLRPPAKAGDPLVLRLKADSDMPRMGAHQVFVGEAAQVVEIDRPGDRPLAMRVVEALGPIHFADVGGLPLKLLWLVVGFAPAILFISGLRLWWRKFLNPVLASYPITPAPDSINAVTAPNSSLQD